MNKQQINERLEYLRGEIEAERISYGEIAELQSLAKYINKNDVVLLEWAGVPEDSTTDSDEINISWHILDVKSLDESLTDEECRQVLQMAKHNHDANIGINWDVLQQYIDELKEV